MSLTNPRASRKNAIRIERASLLLIMLFVSTLQFTRVVIGEESPILASTRAQAPRGRLDSRPATIEVKKLSTLELQTALEDAAIRDDRAFHRLLAGSADPEQNIRNLLLSSLQSGDEIMGLALTLELRAFPVRLPSSFLSSVSELLRSSNSEVRLNTVEFLGLVPQMGTLLVPAIRDLVFDSSPRIRYRALTALRRLEDTHFATFLCVLDALNDPVPAIQNQATSILGNFHSANAEISLFANLGSGTGKIRKEVKPEKQSLIQELHDEASDVRAKAAMKISESGVANPEILQALAEAMKDQDARVRFAAGFALQKFGLRALPAITQASKDADPKVRLNALQAISALDPAIPEVRRVIETIFATEEDPVVQFQASFPMLKIHPDTTVAIEALIEELPFAHGELKDHILQTLKGADREILREKLMLASRSDNLLLQEEAARVLLLLPAREQ